MTALIADRLRRRVRTSGAEPLITYYDVPAGVRTELSAVTFANWVDKTCNLVVDDLLLDPGDVVALEVATTDPGHWVTACWQLACWQLGLTVSVGDALTPRLRVCGPDPAAPEDGVEVLACSLHPLGMGLSTPPPAGVLDYALEVRAQPDGHAAAPQSGLQPAWADPARRLTQAQLVAAEAEPERRLLQPSDPWTTARDGIVLAVVSGGSVVVVVGADDDRRARIAEDERVGGTLP